MIKNIIILLALVMSSSSFSQSYLKKVANQIKERNIKEVKIYQQNIENETIKSLSDWSFYDQEGRMIEKKGFTENGEFESLYKFEYPNERSRLFISFDEKGKEIERREQEYELSMNKEPQNQFSADGYFEYEYNKNGDKTKMWRINDGPKKLINETIYNEKGLPVKWIQVGEYRYISTFEYDDNEYLIKSTTELNREIDSIIVYEYIKYKS